MSVATDRFAREAAEEIRAIKIRRLEFQRVTHELAESARADQWDYSTSDRLSELHAEVSQREEVLRRRYFPKSARLYVDAMGGTVITISPTGRAREVYAPPFRSRTDVQAGDTVNVWHEDNDGIHRQIGVLWEVADELEPVEDEDGWPVTQKRFGVSIDYGPLQWFDIDHLERWGWAIEAERENNLRWQNNDAAIRAAESHVREVFEGIERKDPS